MSESLGEYLPLSQLDNEIALNYWPRRYTLQWSQCGKIPDFVANYLASIESDRGSPNAGNLRATISYLLNELVENSVKYYIEGTIRIRVGIHDDEIVLVVVNQITKEEKPVLLRQFSELIKSDAEEIFIARMEGQGDSDLDHDQSEREVSNLGLLSMIIDYQAKLGWSFAPVDSDEDKIWMHTMVRVPYHTAQGK